MIAQAMMVMMVMMVMSVMLLMWIRQGLASPSQMKWEGEGDRTEIGKIGYTNHEYSSGLLGEQQTEERGWYSQTRGSMDWLLESLIHLPSRSSVEGKPSEDHLLSFPQRLWVLDRIHHFYLM